MSNEFINIIRTYFGTDKVGIKSILLVSSLFLISAWLPDGIVTIFSIFCPKISTAWLQVGIPFIMIFTAFFWFRHIADTHELSVKIDEKPSSAKALILFLSENKNPKEYQCISSIDEMKSNWQMPLIALNYHAISLSTVKIVTSFESGKQFEEFKNTVHKLLPNFEVSMINKYHNEINFENAESVFKTLDIIYTELLTHIKKESIYIDLTGGTKVVALAGSIFALPEDRTVQYVSTTDNKVRLYDLQYHPNR